MKTKFDKTVCHGQTCLAVTYLLRTHTQAREDAGLSVAHTLVTISKVSV